MAVIELEVLVRTRHRGNISAEERRVRHIPTELRAEDEEAILLMVRRAISGHLAQKGVSR